MRLSLPLEIDLGKWTETELRAPLRTWRLVGADPDTWRGTMELTPVEWDVGAGMSGSIQYTVLTIFVNSHR